MSLRSDLTLLNQRSASTIQRQLPYTLEDCRRILLDNTKFNKRYTFDGILFPETVAALTSEGLEVFSDGEKTTVSWEIR